MSHRLGRKRHTKLYGSTRAELHACQRTGKLDYAFHVDQALIGEYYTGETLVEHKPGSRKNKLTRKLNRYLDRALSFGYKGGNNV